MSEDTLIDRNPRRTAALKRKLDWIVSLCIVGFVAVIYLLTLSKGVFPGQSASLMATFTGIEPQIAPSHPVWGAIVGFLGKMGTVGMALRLNLFSMILAVACVGMLYHIVTSALFAAFDTQQVEARIAVKASVIGAALSSLTLAFCVPFWMTATRLHFQVFDLFFLLVLTHIFLAYARTKFMPLIFLFALLYGVAIVECLSIGLFAPLFVFFAFRIWIRENKVSGANIFGSLFCFIIGLAFYLLVARHFFLTEDITLRNYSGYWPIVTAMIEDQIRIFKASIPELGWVFIVVCVVLPWLATLAIAARALNEKREWSFICFHIALTAIAIATVTNTPISRWGIEMANPQGVFPVFLYALTAMVTGYAGAYWYTLVANRKYLIKRELERPEVKTSIWFGYGLGYLLVVVIALASVINAFEASGKRGAFADECAKELLSHLEGREWLVTDGMFDNHLRLAAAEKGQTLKLIELQKNDNPIYIRQLKKIIENDPEFAKSDRVRLMNAADLNVMSFIQDWIASDSNVVDRIAVMNAPDLLVGAGYTVVPNYFCFIGVKDAEAIKNDPVLEKYGEFWKRMMVTLAKSRGLNDVVAAYRAEVRRQVGFVANNAGVMLEDFGRDEEAYQVYTIVRQIDSENVSALLNRVELLNRKKAEKFHAEDFEAVEKELHDFVAGMKYKLSIWSLSRFYGYVRSPVLFAQLGWTWALSGQPGIALAGLERAADVATTVAARTRAKEAIGDVLMSQNDDEKSEEIFNSILDEDPGNERALLGNVRINMRRGSLDKAREWLTKAKEAGVDNTSLAIESAALDLAANRPEEARVKLTEVTELQPRNLQALGMLAVAMVQMGDFEEVEKKILPKMESVAGGTANNYLVLITRGQLAYSKGKDHYESARDAFEQAAKVRPGLPVLMEWILRLDFMLVDKNAAEEHARQLLKIDRNNSFANYIMGSLMLERGNPEKAEDYLRRSANTSKTPEALNDLAELLRKTGNRAEAETQIRAAIKMAPDFYVLYDTLGGILSDSGRLDEAEEAFAMSLKLFEGDYRIHLNMAKLLFKKGNFVKAREIVAKIQPHRSELPQAEQEELAQLVRQLTPGRK